MAHKKPDEYIDKTICDSPETGAYVTSRNEWGLGEVYPDTLYDYGNPEDNLLRKAATFEEFLRQF